MVKLKFKAYDKKEKCWIDGFSIHNSGLFSDLINAKEVNGICIADAHWEKIDDLEHIEIVQYLGLKDCKGRKVYEGDILEPVTCGSILGGKFYSGFGGYDKYYVIKDIRDVSWDLKRDIGNYKIVGNIFENNELLK